VQVAIGTLALGTATGLRSQMGMAAVLLGLNENTLPRSCRKPGARLTALTAAAGELVVDKLPGTPDRTEPLGLAARISLAALACGILASSASRKPLPAAVIGAGTAVAAAFGGRVFRQKLSTRLPPVAAALVEDALAVSVAVLAVRLIRE